MRKYDLEKKLREIYARKTDSELAHERKIKCAIALPLIAAAAISTAYAFSYYFKKETKVSASLETNISRAEPVKVEIVKPSEPEEKIIPEEIKPPAENILAANEVKDTNINYDKEQDSQKPAPASVGPNGEKIYSRTVKELELLLEHKKVSRSDKCSVKLIVDEIKRGFKLHDGWEPKAYKDVSEYLLNEKKVPKEKLTEELGNLVENATVEFVEGGMPELQITVVDGTKKVFMKNMNITPNAYFGGNVETILIRALKSAGYTD